MIAAILRAQLLSMRPGSSRGTGIAALAAFFWYGFWLFVSWSAAYLSAHAAADVVRTGLPLGLLGVCFYWQAMPVLSASLGSSLDLRKLLVYPAPHGDLFLVELLLRFITGIEMQMVLAGVAIGLVRNRASGGPAALPALAGAIPLFILFNVLLASGTRSLLERLLARRKVRELVALLLAAVWVVPRFFAMTGSRPAWLQGAGAVAGAIGWPWSSAAHAALPLGQSGGTVALSWLSLGVWVVLAGWFGRTQFERNLRYDTLAAQATPMTPVSARAARWTERFYRVPSLVWHDPLAAIVEKELRTLARSPRFRMVFVMGFTFGLMIWLPMVLRRNASHAGFLGQNFLVIVCVYAMTLIGQVSYWNCFGIDRSAAIFYFAAPQPISRTLIGKNIACLFFVYLETLVLMSITLAVRVDFSLGKAFETLAVIGICATYLMALGNLSSVHYPRSLSPERVSQGGGSGSNRAQALVMMLYPVVLLPVMLAYVARFAFESQAAFSIVLAMAAVIAAIFYAIALESSVKAASARRQYILEELSKGDGPVGS
jgi:ABC-2 type transport system permease protein